ncbi:MAG TPA: PSD1 and planctomycete cytochrome C domain-containing protein, partial [Candidatus Saccharimonadales bacterium]|nr:PSD1 and planctomycete cytochrome C domain-containing protein [Candidatus Saccharimonadales bacterium]
MTEPHRTLTAWCVGQLRWLAILIACEVGPPRAPGAEAVSAGDATFFETRIRPVLAQHCVSCHGEEKQKGKLRLDSEAGLRAGGESGPVVVPGHPEQSRLIQAVTHTHADLQLPPKKKLGARAIADLTRWVKAGAAWPASPPAAAARPGKGGSEVTEQDRAWWAFQPIRRPPVPSTKWQARAANPIDRFVFAQLETKGLTPNPSANPRELVRRLHFDLVGLPPSPEEVDAFASHPTSEAWEELVDRLLARPEYGERWGRHWLDVVRFAQSNGYERDGEKPYAWRYRDYVVRAFNQDKPYDQFVREQIAGDELPEAGADAIIATGFQRLGVWDDEPDDKRLAEFEELDDILSTTSTAFLGLTLGCARCHDHKFDPIPHADYYRMLAFYRNVTLYENARYAIDSPNYIPLADRAAVAEWKQAHASRLKPLEEALAGATNAETKKKLARQVEQTKGESPPFPWALAIRERGPRPPPTHVLIRGNAGSEGPEVEPAFLSVLGGRKPDLPEPAPGAVSSGRRRVLAEWIASPSNPLTARVMANRIWQHHFGRGLVKTASDFGHAGTPPTHPQLLDWLADEFIAHGWSVKALHKTILLSAVYRMSSRTDNTQAEAADPDNDFFWRQNLRRLEAESLRDTVLAISGQLNPVAGGRGFFPRLSGEVLAGQSRPGLDWEISSQAELARRSIYAYVRRTMPIPVLEAFDYNNTASPVSERPVTTVAPQALMLLNDEFMQTQADAWAARLVREAGPSPERQIQRGFRLALGRDPTAREAALAR